MEKSAERSSKAYGGYTRSSWATAA